jgi:multidrug resistance efflux pump
MRSMTRLTFICIVALAAATVLSGCGSQALSSGDLTASGTIGAPTVYVAPEIAGKVADLAVDKGDTVAEGDVLAHWTRLCSMRSVTPPRAP